MSTKNVPFRIDFGTSGKISKHLPKQDGYSVFMAKQLHRGKFERQIKNAVKKSRNFIIVLFPGDLDNSNSETDWLRKESKWATDCPNINIIPVFCDNFDDKEIKDKLPDCLKEVLRNQGIIMHKDYSLDSDLDKLCDMYLHKANPVRSRNTPEFFNKILRNQKHLSIESIDVAFHAGAPWIQTTGNMINIFAEILERKIPMRVLINTSETAESIGKYMRNPATKYDSFEELQQYIKIKKEDGEMKSEYDRIYVKYYVYRNYDPQKIFGHELNSSSEYYKMYQEEFEFLWSKSKTL